MGRFPPLVIFGLDAGDPAFIEGWAAAGHLPTIASVMQRGSWARTGGSELLTEHGAWVAVFSGVSRGQHGYYYYRQLAPGTYDLETRTGLDTDAPAFWSYLRGGNKRVAIVDAPDVPPIAGLAGIQLANWATHANWDPTHFAPAAEPPELLADVRREFGPKLVTIEKPDSSCDEDRALLRQLLEQTATKGALCRRLLPRGPFDLVVAVFAASHAASHQFWRYQPGLPDGVEDGELSCAIRDVYRAIDEQIGRLLEGLPQETNVVVVSSVGMADDFPTPGLIEAFCRELGYQPRPAGTMSARLRPLDLARRVIPERWRVAMSRRLSRARREALLADQFRTGSDWARTTAFAVPASYTSFLRVNLRGREPQGVVAPGAEYDALLDRIEQDLRSLRDAETGQPVVGSISRTRRAFRDPPHPALPDLFVQWKPGRFWRRVLHPRAELTHERPEFYRRSDHSTHGFFAACGPMIKQRGLLGEVDVLDLAPTFLAAIGEQRPARMAGRVLTELLAE